MPRLAVLLPVVIAFLVGAPPALAWTWPVGGPVLQHFQIGDDPYAGGQHRGIDIGAAAGTPVLAPAAGLVSFAGTVPGGGRTITIRTPDGYAVTLQELGAFSVGKGDAVREAQEVATVATAGGAPEQIHLGVRVAADPNGYVDPLALLPPEASPAPVEQPEDAESAAVSEPGLDAEAVSGPEEAGETGPPADSQSGSAPEGSEPVAAPAAVPAGTVVASSSATTAADVPEPSVPKPAAALAGGKAALAPAAGTTIAEPEPFRAAQRTNPAGAVVAERRRVTRAPADSSEPAPSRSPAKPWSAEAMDEVAPGVAGAAAERAAGSTLDRVVGTAGVLLCLLVLAAFGRRLCREARGRRDAQRRPAPPQATGGSTGSLPDPGPPVTPRPAVADRRRRSGPRHAVGSARSRRVGAAIRRPYDWPL